MRIVYTYLGPRDTDLEREVAADVSRRFGPAESGEPVMADDGTITVTVELPGTETPGEDVATGLRGHPKIIDAAEGSFGEGV